MKTGVLATQVWVPRDGAQWGRIFVRGPTKGYCGIAAPEAETSDVELIASDEHIYFLRQRGRRTPVGWGFSVQHILRYHTRSGVLDSFAPADVLPDNVFVVGLKAAASEGDAVLAVVGISSVEPHSFHLAQVGLLRFEFRLLRELQAVFA
jgi:hypothetical protein